MWKNLFFKEWLKTKRIFLTSLAVSIVIMILIFLQIRSDVIHSESYTVWYKILFMKDQFYSLYMYFPLLTGVALAFFQFMPEVNHKRMKLTFHLPLQSHVSIFVMGIFGLALNLTCIFLSLLVFKILSGVYLPQTITQPAVYSMIPWAINGVTGYYIIACVLLEAHWRQKALILLIGVTSLILPYQKTLMLGFNPMLPVALLICVLWFMGLFYAAHRFFKIN